MKKMPSVSLIIVLSFLVAVPVFAIDETASVTATTANPQDAVNSTTTTTSIADDEKIEIGDVNIKITEVENLDGVEVDTIEKIPSNFGLWWRSVRETLVLTFTWNEMSKAERSLEFAEERMRIAKMIAEQQPNDAEAQEKAQKMIAKAQRFMERVETKKDKWSKDKNKEEVNRLVSNIATHQSNADVILDELEKELSGDAADAISELREKGSETNSRLLNAIANENISAETKEHLEEIKNRIEEHAAQVQEYNKERKELQEQVRSGVEGAQEDLQALKEERQTQIQTRTENVAEIKTQLQEQAADGDAAAQKKLEIINRIQEKAEEKIQERAEIQAQTTPVNATKDTEVQGGGEQVKETVQETVQEGNQVGSKKSGQ